MEFESLQHLPADAVNFAVNGGFENRPLMTLAATSAVVGLTAIASRYRQMRNEAETLVLPDPDMAKESQKRFSRHRAAVFMAGLSAVTALSAGAAHEADPFIETSENQIESVAAIVDMSYESYAKDVQEGDSTTTRLQAAVNGINEVDDLSGIKVTFIAAGDTAEAMGTIEDGSGKGEVVENFEGYYDKFGTRSSADLVGALGIANATEADRILVFTGSVEGVSTELSGEADEDNNRTSVVALGQSGSTVTFLGRERPADINESANSLIVGKDDSYTASSVEELQAVVSGIVDEQYVAVNRDDFDGFENLRDIAGGLLVAGVAGNTVMHAVSRASRKRTP
ncbi:hypothetical protein BH23PAT2_BH23PAT2_06830 [soil metagenome]